MALKEQVSTSSGISQNKHYANMGLTSMGNANLKIYWPLRAMLKIIMWSGPLNTLLASQMMRVWRRCVTLEDSLVIPYIGSVTPTASCRKRIFTLIKDHFSFEDINRTKSRHCSNWSCVIWRTGGIFCLFSEQMIAGSNMEGIVNTVPSSQPLPANPAWPSVRAVYLAPATSSIGDSVSEWVTEKVKLPLLNWEISPELHL